MAQKFAIFDIDGTVIRWQLFHSVVSELINRQQINEAAAASIKLAHATWKRRDSEDSFVTYEKVLVKAYFEAMQHISVPVHDAAIDSVFSEYKDQVYTYTRDLIRDLKARDYLLFAISGSQQEIVSKFADYYGFDAAVGAQLEQVDGQFTGNFVSPAQHGKQASLDKLLQQYDLGHAGSYAVGDTESDAVLLAAVENPIAFNPSAGLYKIARKRSWPIVVERKNVTYELGPHDGQYLLA